MDNHRLHNYDETEVLISKRSAAVNDLLETAETLISEGEDKVDFNDMKRKSTACHKEMMMALASQFESFHKYFSDRENFLLKCLQTMMERDHADIGDAEKDFMQLTSKFQSIVADAQKLLDQPKGVSFIAESKRLSRDLEENIGKVCNPPVMKDKSVQLIFTDEESKVLKDCVDKLGALVDAEKVPFKSGVLTPNLGRGKLSKNRSLPAISLHSKTSTSDNIETDSNILQPAAIISCTEKGKKFYPCGVAVGSNNLITVSDLHNNFVKVLTGTGKVIDTIESSKGSHALKGPCALNVDRGNDIYILERESKSIGKYTNGSLIDLGKFKQFDDPRGILVIKEKVYVTDWEKNCIHVLTLVCNKLSYQSMIGESCLKQPAGIACDNSNEKIVVCDQENHCVWVLTPEGDVINVIGGERGSRLGMLNVPYGVAVTGDGKVIISEKGNCRLSVFSLHGSHLFSFGSKGSNPGQFNQLRHICTNFNKQVLVADELNQRVQIFDI